VWGFIWAFIVNAFINIKFMLSLATLLSLQAYYIGSGQGTAQLVIAIISCVTAAMTAHNLWIIMQFMLRQTMFQSQLIDNEPPPLTLDNEYKGDNEYNVQDMTVFIVAGVLSITLYCLCAKPLRQSSLFQLELAFGLLWLCLSVLVCIPPYLLAVPTVCTIGVLRGCILTAAQIEESEGRGKGDVLDAGSDRAASSRDKGSGRLGSCC
jgi:hypothetical protein